MSSEITACDMKRRHSMTTLAISPPRNSVDRVPGDPAEGALVSRPGRIDQATEFPLPDAKLRARLIKFAEVRWKPRFRPGTVPGIAR